MGLSHLTGCSYACFSCLFVIRRMRFLSGNVHSVRWKTLRVFKIQNGFQRTKTSRESMVFSAVVRKSCIFFFFLDWGQFSIQIGNWHGIILPGEIQQVTPLVFIDFDWSFYSCIFVYSVDITFS